MEENNMTKENLKKYYHNLCEVFGVNSSVWTQLHTNYSPYYFCEENRLAIVGEYLTWLDFVKMAKEKQVVYYWGIDSFLQEYHDAISRVTSLDITLP